MSEDRQDRPGVIAPPPFIYLGFLLLGLGLDYAWPVALVPDGLQYAAGGALMALALAVAVAAVRELRRAGTNVDVRKPTTAIVASGPYRYSRNPMYVALSALYAGIAIAADNVWMLALLVPALAVIRAGVIAREERYLEGKFGDSYLRYKASVRRWL